MEKIAHSRWTYIKHATAHPWHFVMLTGALVFGISNGSFLVFLSVLLTSEIILHIIIMRMKSFRNYVDERMTTIVKSNATEKRNNILYQMREDHRKELYGLEKEITNLKGRLSNFPAISTLAADECNDLLSQYIRLAIQYNLMSGSDSSVSVYSIESQIASLQHQQQRTNDEVYKQRLSIAARRLEIVKASSGIRDGILNKMNAVKEMLLLKTEQAILPAPVGQTEALRLRVDDSPLVDELMEYAHVEDIDMDAFQLGR